MVVVFDGGDLCLARIFWSPLNRPWFLFVCICKRAQWHIHISNNKTNHLNHILDRFWSRPRPRAPCIYTFRWFYVLNGIWMRLGIINFICIYINKVSIISITNFIFACYFVWSNGENWFFIAGGIVALVTRSFNGCVVLCMSCASYCYQRQKWEGTMASEMNVSTASTLRFNYDAVKRS